MLGGIEAVIFDLDGTMWDALEEICHTWNIVVANHPELRSEPIAFDEMSGCLGLPMTKIAERLFPAAGENERALLMEECCRVENEYLYEHGAKLYPGLYDTLMELKKNYRLFVVSNCQSGYIESFMHAHGLEDCFDDTQCWGDNKVSKGENNRLIMARNNIKYAVYVGDTAGDEQSAREAGIPFIFAAYGFGEAVSPDYTINSFAELVEIMKK